MRTGSNFSLHWTGSSRFSLFQWLPRWRLLPASELRRSAAAHAMTLQSALIFLGLTLALSLAVHWFVRRYWFAVLISVTAASLVNIIHEAFVHDFQIRPADVAFWIPMEFFQGMVFALPVAAVVGIPFYVIRRRRHTNLA